MSSFINDERGISEEFTSLPALTVVMIGFGLFIALIAGAYYSYNDRIESIDKYEAANFVLEKMTITLREEKIIREGEIIDKIQFKKSVHNYKAIVEKSGIVGINFGLKLSYEENGGIHSIEWDNIPSDKDVVAVSKQVAVYLNEAETVPGILTVFVWGEE